LPTGGIHPDEEVLDAIKREVYEETGLPVQLKEMLGIITIKFRCKDKIIDENDLYFSSDFRL